MCSDSVGAFIINQKIEETRPVIAVLIQILHGGLQAGLKARSVIFKQPHNQAPNHSGFDGK